MADTETAEETETSPAAEPASSEPSALDKLEAKVDKLAQAVERLMSGGKSEPTGEDQAQAASVADEVRAELARLKQAEDRKSRRDADSKRLDEVEAKVQKIAEKPPREYRRITQRLWGDE